MKGSGMELPGDGVFDVCEACGGLLAIRSPSEGGAWTANLCRCI